MLRKWLGIYQKIVTYRREARRKNQLDSLFAISEPKVSQEEISFWLLKLSMWLRDGELSAEQWPVRSRFLFQVLERNPNWNEIFQSHLQTFFAQIRILDLLSESGLPLEQGLWSEFWDRVFAMMLPQKPLVQDPSRMLDELFPDGTNLEALNLADFNPWLTALAPSTQHFVSDAEEAFVCLISQACAIALEPSLRKRMQVKRTLDLPWYVLSRAGENFVQTRDSTELSRLLQDCHKSLDMVYIHLRDYGVSTNLVFRLEKLRLFLTRLSLLIPILQNPSPSSVKALFLHLIDLNHKKRGLGALFRQSGHLLSEKIVKKNSETGDHYIGRTPAERWKLFKKAAGGGFLTAFTVYLKFALSALPLTAFLAGLVASLNYSIGFLLIQAFGWTLATKQPANTATTIASKLKDLQSPEKLQSLTDEVAALFRSQLLAVIGNVTLVIPTALSIAGIYWYVTGKHVLTLSQATYNLEAVTPGVTTFLFAAWTGVLLWLSSVAAGWVDNWCAFREIPLRLEQNTTLRHALSPQAAEKVADWFRHQMPAVVSNVFLGFLLGLSPEIFYFFGVPLNVRHVTLSTGSLFASLPVLGWDVVKSQFMIWAAFGIFSIALLNLGVSFWLAFNIALRSQNISRTQKRRILKALFGRIFKS